MQVPLAAVEEIPQEGVKKVDFFGREVLLTRSDGQPKAIMNVCMHLGGPLEQDGDKLVCAWHQAEWDMHNGRRPARPPRPAHPRTDLPAPVHGRGAPFVY